MTRINTNVSSLVAQNTLGQSNASLNEALTRLSTGLRINTGKDDPAGLIASENLRSDITAIGRAISNTDRANQVIATADSALGQVSSLLNDIRGLVTESANSGALSDEQLAANQLQVDSSLEALNRIAQTTTFQGRRLLDGSLDFITSSTDSDFSNITDLNIDQANLGATGSIDVDITVSAAATQAQVDVASIPGAVTAVEADTNFDLTLNQAAIASSTTAGTSFTVDVATAQAATTTDLSFGATTVEINVAANAGQPFDGTLGNISVTVNDGTPTAGNASAAIVGGNIVVTATGGTATATDIINAINAIDEDGDTNQDFTATVSSGSSTEGFRVADDGATTNLVGGTEGTATETFSATSADGENFSLNIQVADTGAGEIVVSGDTTNGINVVVDDTAIVTLGDIATAINGGTSLTDAAFTNSSTVFNAQFATNNTSLDQDVTFSGGTTAVSGTVAIDVTSTEAAATYNGYTFNVTEGTGTANTVTASIDDANDEIDIDITGTVTAQNILDAINNLDGFDAALDTANTTSGLGLTNSYVEASDSVTSGTFANGVDGGGGLAGDVVIELSGTDGSEVFSFGSGTTIDELADGINLVSDATGVAATVNGTTLELVSSAFGSNAFVDLNVISEASGTVFSDAEARDEGTDVVASINGVSATGDGNEISINTATLDLSATLDSSFVGTASFTIDGGGALFQLGPDVVTNQQARLGIGSVNTARLGGASGKLFSLGTGGANELSSDNLDTAAAIIEEAIDQVTSLRGRLGAFQRTTLETNKSALNDTLVNLTDAESTIRDADFAAESAALTRSQILVQSGTAVLQIANSNPQNVLALLG